MRILVLGHRGVIGSELIRNLRKSGDDSNFIIVEPERDVDIVDTNSVLEVVDQYSVEMIVNAAATGVKKDVVLRHALEVNAKAPARLVEALCEANSSTCYLHIGSSSELLDVDDAQSPYVVSKGRGSDLVRASQLAGLGRAKLAYLNNVYSRSNDQSFVWLALESALEEREFQVLFPNRQRDFCWIGDVAGRLIHLIENWQRFPREVELGTGEPKDLFDVAQIIYRTVGTGEGNVIAAGRESEVCATLSTRSPYMMKCTTSLQEGIRNLLREQR